MQLNVLIKMEIKIGQRRTKKIVNKYMNTVKLRIRAFRVFFKNNSLLPPAGRLVARRYTRGPAQNRGT